MPRYNPAQIEPKWQAYWQDHKTFAAPDMPGKKKLYALDMFPYPSGDGLHVGHPEGYTATDIVSRFHRMKGYSVLHPMGFDAFGLPAEEHAIKTNTPPRVQTEKNIETFTRQLKMLGFSYDWDRVVATTDVSYFKWTQFIFLVLFDTWFDHQQQKGRPISDLPIPPDVTAQGTDAVRIYRDEHRLAFQSDALVNWCPLLGTVLANEEVIDGKSERGSHSVQRIPLRQWMLRITDYADRLESELEDLDWSYGIKKLQKDWIGRSTGAEVDFYIGEETNFKNWSVSRAQSGFPRKPAEDVLRVYTTRPDTLFGATYMVIAPEHPFVEKLTTSGQAEAVKEYCDKAAAKSDMERTELSKTKTGVFTGSHAINPINGKPVPVWIADYVLISYGTGAIMAVPAHDTRDYEFAKQFDIPIIAVVDPVDAKDVDRDAVLAGEDVFSAHGVAVNSGQYDGTTTAEFKKKITSDLELNGLGKQATNYKLRDWLFSRQRFWGEPFPILHELDDAGNPTGAMRAVDVVDLPVDLPHLEDYKPHGKPEPPLGKAGDEWLYVTIDGKRYRRETNTMPQWAGSCWYYLRFIDPKNDDVLIDKEKEKAWMPVDLYVGGAEHAVLHLLYARFWHKVLYDRGYVSTREPFQKLVNQGMILGQPVYSAFYKTETRELVSADQPLAMRVGDEPNPPPTLKVLLSNTPTGTNVNYDKETEDCFRIIVEFDDVEEKGMGRYVLREKPTIAVRHTAEKMSKSRGNVVNPDEVVNNYGADSLRLYEMFMGPLEATKPWNMDGVGGVRSFLDRAWRMIVDERSETLTVHDAVNDSDPNDDQLRMLHKTIKAVTLDLESLNFNTAIARLMEFVNFFTKQKFRPKSVMNDFVLLLSPMAPHICEELWHLLGATESLSSEPWPEFEAALTVDALVEIPVQIKGKIKAKVKVVPDIAKEDLESAAREAVGELLEGQTIKKAIVVPGRLVNFVV